MNNGEWGKSLCIFFTFYNGFKYKVSAEINTRMNIALIFVMMIPPNFKGILSQFFPNYRLYPFDAFGGSKL